MLALGLFGFGALASPAGAGTLVGLGAALAVVALATLGPALTRPVLRLLGGSGDRFGIAARIARRNSMRTPRRTWTTAGALTIGLALVSSVVVLAGSMKASASAVIDTSMRADVILTASNVMTGGTVPPVLAAEVGRLPEAGAVSPYRIGNGQVSDEPATVVAIDPATWDEVSVTTVTEGSLAALAAPGTVAVDEERAAELGLAVGDQVGGSFPAAGAVQLEVVATFEPDQLLVGWVTSVATTDTLFTQPLDAAVLVAAAPGVGPADLQTAIDQVAAAYPAVTVQDQAEYRDTVAGQIDQMLALVTALLGMALFIAVLGIMNTLALSIHERTREIGLLRAVGMTRRQVRRMVRWEAVTVASLGTVVGLLLGVAVGWATTRTLVEEGMSSFVVPGSQLAGAVVLAVLAGVLAAVLPARTAARLDVLRAVTVE